MKKILCLLLSLLMLSTVFANIAFARDIETEIIDKTFGERDTVFNEAYSVIDWNARYADSDVIAVVRTVEVLYPEDFPLLDLVDIDQIFDNLDGYRQIVVFRLANPGRDEVKETIEIIRDNYPIVESAEPNYYMDMDFDFVEDPYSTPYGIEPKVGDVNADWRFNLKDAALLLRYIAGLEQLHEKQLKMADVNGDGDVNAQDASKIIRKIGGWDD